MFAMSEICVSTYLRVTHTASAAKTYADKPRREKSQEITFGDERKRVNALRLLLECTKSTRLVDHSQLL